MRLLTFTHKAATRTGALGDNSIVELILKISDTSRPKLPKTTV